MSVNKALDSVLAGKLDEMRTHFSSALTTKAVEKLEERKMDIAQNYFGQMQEEVEQIDEDKMYKGFMLGVRDHAKSMTPKRFAKEYPSMAKHQEIIAKTPRKDIHKLAVDKNGSPFMRMNREEVEQIDELRNFKNETDVLDYVAKARKQIGNMDAYDTSPEGEKKFKTGERRIRGMQLLVKKAEKAKKKG